MAALVDLDEAATEPKYVQKPTGTNNSTVEFVEVAVAEVAQVAASSEDAEVAQVAASSELVSQPVSHTFCADQSDEITADFGAAVPVPASSFPPLSAPVVTGATGRPPLQELPLHDQLQKQPTPPPAETTGGPIKRRSRVPEQVSEYEQQRNANVDANTAYLMSLGLGPPPPKKPKHRTKPAFVRRAVSTSEADALLAVCPASVLTQANVVGAVLAIPQNFFTYTEKENDVWGYVATVTQKVRSADKPAFSLKFHDCTTPFYLEQHPNYTPEEKEAGIHERYLQNPGVKVLQLGKAS